MINPDSRDRYDTDSHTVLHAIQASHAAHDRHGMRLARRCRTVSLIKFIRIGDAFKLSIGMSKNPCICMWCKSIVSTWSTPVLCIQEKHMRIVNAVDTCASGEAGAPRDVHRRGGRAQRVI